MCWEAFAAPVCRSGTLPYGQRASRSLWCDSIGLRFECRVRYVIGQECVPRHPEGYAMTQPNEWYNLWRDVRSVLEALYFLSGVGIFIAACYASRQVRIASEQLRLASDQLKTTREIADANSRRESVKLAADLCKYYAHDVVPKQDMVVNKYKAGQCTFLDAIQQVPPAFVIKDGDFSQVNYDLKRATPEWAKVATEIITYLNMCESFAIPFVAGVADDDIGFQETAVAFVTTINAYMPAIYYLRMTQGVRYASVLKLWGIWHGRLAAQALLPALKGLQDLVDAVEKNKIKPI